MRLLKLFLLSFLLLLSILLVLMNHAENIESLKKDSGAFGLVVKSEPSKKAEKPRLEIAKFILSRKLRHLDTKVPPSTAISRSRDSFTVVTALLDIGRGQWWHFRRPYEYYLKFMRHVLSLDVNLVVYIEEKGAKFVRKFRREKGLLARTRIEIAQFEDLDLYRYYGQAKKIMEKEKREWKSGWEIAIRNHPEVSSARYDLTVNSKPYFLNRAVGENHFNSEYFFWFDAGYGHDKVGVFPADGRWVPTRLMTPELDDKITVVKLVHESLTLFPLEKLYRQDISVVSGGFLGGHKDAVARLYAAYRAAVLELLDGGVLDDDQTVLVLLINKYPQMFNVVFGDWYDGAKMG